MRSIKIVDIVKKNKFLDFSLSSFGHINLYIIMSQSATLIRVAKRALDGTAIYPHNTQNTIYYQPFDLSSTSSNSTSTPKYVAYTIQRPHDHVISLASHHCSHLYLYFICCRIDVEKEKRRI